MEMKRKLQLNAEGSTTVRTLALALRVSLGRKKGSVASMMVTKMMRTRGRSKGKAEREVCLP
jgi:hypothetical protein